MSTVSINCDFLDAMIRLPAPIQRKVRQFVSKFMSDPKSSGINYERIQQAPDKNLRSVRVDQAYRAIIFKSPKEDAHVLLWVDNHDDAYAWACRRRLVVNERTGALQILVPTEVETVAVDTPPALPSFLARFGRENLLDCGVPEDALGALDLISSDDELERLRGLLPQEAFEALSFLASGIPIEEVKAAFADQPAVDPENFEAALAHPDSKRRFAPVTSQKELEEILDAPLEKWRVFLHPSQRRLVDREFRGPVKVLGGPGTGKTVVAMHRARYLSERLDIAGRVLFTTFTANLAENLNGIMQGFVSPAGLQRLDVMHLHNWLVRFLKTMGISFEVASNDEVNEFWRQAIASTGQSKWPPSFLERELHDVVMTNDITTRDAYLTVSRRGARGALRRAERAQVWPVIEEYLKILNLNHKREWLMLIKEARQYLEANPQARPYGHVVVDEAQDFHPEDWKLIRALAPVGPNDLFIVGDGHQRIYGRKVVLSRCGIDTRGRSSTLKLNYRTTHEIRSWATAMFEGRPVDDLDEGIENLKGYSSLLAGLPPEVHVFASEHEEAGFLVQLLGEAAENGGLEGVCIVGRTRRFLESRIYPVLDNADIPYVILQQGVEVHPGSVSVATMHRVKGLEFPTVVLAGAEEGLVPLTLRDLQDDEVADHEAQERALLFMAATRARERLIVMGTGKLSKFVGSSSCIDADQRATHS